MKAYVCIVSLTFSTALAFGQVTGPEQGLFQKDWFLGGIFGVAATLLGFGLTILWDLLKMRNDAKDKERVILHAIGEELAENSSILKDNLNLVEKELSILAYNQSIVQPMRLFRTGFWDVAKFNLIPALLIGERLQKIHKAATLAELCNEQIRSRENYRIHNASMNNYSQRLLNYDEPLRDALLVLKAALASVVLAESKPADTVPRAESTK